MDDYPKFGDRKDVWEMRARGSVLDDEPSELATMYPRRSATRTLDADDLRHPGAMRAALQSAYNEVRASAVPPGAAPAGAPALRAWHSLRGVIGETYEMFDNGDVWPAMGESVRPAEPGQGEPSELDDAVKHYASGVGVATACVVKPGFLEQRWAEYERARDAALAAGERGSVEGWEFLKRENRKKSVGQPPQQGE